MCTVYEPFVWLNHDFETRKLTHPLRMPSNSTSLHTLNQEVGLSKTFCQGRRFLDTCVSHPTFMTFAKRMSIMVDIFNQYKVVISTII